MSSQALRLGWIGLGSMGLAMATNIQKHLSQNSLPPLRYTNRTLSRGEPLKAIGGTSYETVEELAQDCGVIFISVSNDEALNHVTSQILQSGSIRDKIIVDTTTVHPNTTASISTRLSSAGASFIAAPVFGATPLAISGQLLVAIAGPSTATSIVSPYLKGVIARNILHVGSEPSKALLLKTTSNFVTAGLMYLISEAHVFASKSGLPAEVLEELVKENFGTMAYLDSRRMTQGVYYPAVGQKPYSGLELGMKDVKIGMDIAEDEGMKLRIGELVMEAMEEAKRYGTEKGRLLDSSSMFGVVRQNAGLSFETEDVKRRDADQGKEDKEG